MFNGRLSHRSPFFIHFLRFFAFFCGYVFPDELPGKRWRTIWRNDDGATIGSSINVYAARFKTLTLRTMEDCAERSAT